MLLTFYCEKINQRRIVGFFDGKNYWVQKPANSDLQNAMYNGWLHATLITGTLCFGVDEMIIWGCNNNPGSWQVRMMLKLVEIFEKGCWFPPIGRTKEWEFRVILPFPFQEILLHVFKHLSRKANRNFYQHMCKTRPSKI